MPLSPSSLTGMQRTGESMQMTVFLGTPQALSHHKKYGFLLLLGIFLPCPPSRVKRGESPCLPSIVSPCFIFLVVVTENSMRVEVAKGQDTLMCCLHKYLSSPGKPSPQSSFLWLWEASTSFLLLFLLSYPPAVSRKCLPATILSSSWLSLSPCLESAQYPRSGDLTFCSASGRC